MWKAIFSADAALAGTAEYLTGTARNDEIAAYLAMIDERVRQQRKIIQAC